MRNSVRVKSVFFMIGFFWMVKVGYGSKQRVGYGSKTKGRTRNGL